MNNPDDKDLESFINELNDREPKYPTTDKDEDGTTQSDG